MGNQGSCTSYAISGGGIKVVGDDGRVQEYKRPVGAGQLMLENPGQFVCDFRSLHVGDRVPRLAADQELERRGCYFLLPMDMLYSVLTQEEMDALSSRALASTKRGAQPPNYRALRRSTQRYAPEKPPAMSDDVVWRTPLETIQEDD